MTILDKVQIGSSVQVNLELSKDRLSKETIEAINISSECTISDFKITDGKGIGVILKLSNGKEQWFFENEIEILDDYGNVIEEVSEDNQENSNNLINQVLKNLNYQPKYKTVDLINPVNFIKWLIVSLKDVL